MKRQLLLLLCLLPVQVLASDLNVSKPILYIDAEGPYAVLNVSWENAWNNETNHDGVWLFFKAIAGDGYRHISVLEEGHSTVSTFTTIDPVMAFEAADNGAGVFLYPTAPFRGHISATIKISLEPESFRGFNTRGASFVAYGIEMVQIPSGGFYVGTANQQALGYGAFHNPGSAGSSDGLVRIDAENQVFSVGQNEDIYYLTPEGYEGDQTGTIRAAFPKGVSPFIIMKYEPTEGQYVDFLNSLSSEQQVDRLIHNEDGYQAMGGSIGFENGLFHTPAYQKPCKFMSWADAMGYADWAGLRPMTEFEFTKAARGITRPADGDFPWGTDTKDQVQRFPNERGLLLMRNGWDESYLTDANKPYFGASAYWVMDLAGSMWERVVSIGHEQGRAFIGSHGDGILTSEGQATNEDWPSGEEDAGGVGFRGGGFYGYDREYHAFNPFSPVSYRPYGGWHGVVRTNSYGARFVRSLK